MISVISQDTVVPAEFKEENTPIFEGYLPIPDTNIVLLCIKEEDGMVRVKFIDEESHQAGDFKGPVSAFTGCVAVEDYILRCVEHGNVL